MKLLFLAAGLAMASAGAVLAQETPQLDVLRPAPYGKECPDASFCLCNGADFATGGGVDCVGGTVVLTRPFSDNGWQGFCDGTNDLTVWVKCLPPPLL